MSSVKKACICSICIALCYVLPVVFHAVGAGSLFSPMHIPVLLCGLLCGWPYGLFCGAAGPVISCLLSGMPTPVQLLYMIPELCAYGLVSGLLMGRVRTGHGLADLYLSLIPAMLAGRLVGGAAQAAVYLATARSWSVALWAGAYLVTTAPGIVLQLIVLPPLALSLSRAGLIPRRYPAAQGGVYSGTNG
jgi:hypothetical protein